MTDRGMHPEHGGRVVLKLVRAESDRADYAARLYAPHDAWSAQVAVSAGAIDESAWQPAPPPPPAWLRDVMLALLRQARRQHAASDQQPPATRWPRKITRWRPEPDPARPANVGGASPQTRETTGEAPGSGKAP